MKKLFTLKTQKFLQEHTHLSLMMTMKYFGLVKEQLAFTDKLQQKITEALITKLPLLKDHEPHLKHSIKDIFSLIFFKLLLFFIFTK